MYVIVLKYVKPLSQVDKHMRAHVAYLKAQYRDGVFIASGRRNPRTGGVILARAMSPEALAEILAKDPFFVHGLAEFDIIDFATSMYAEAFEPFADDDKVPRGRVG